MNEKEIAMNILINMLNKGLIDVYNSDTHTADVNLACEAYKKIYAVVLNP